MLFVSIRKLSNAYGVSETDVRNDLAKVHDGCIATFARLPC